MIAGTTFVFGDLEFLLRWAAGRARKIGDAKETLQQVSRRCSDGSAVCLANDDGLVVIAPEQQPDGTMRAMVLLAVAENGRPGAFERQEDAVVAVARELGATQLAFRTTRKGWGRLVGPHWARDGDLYTRGV